MDDPEQPDLRAHLSALPTSDLLESLARHRREEELTPEACLVIESILRERGIAIEAAVQALLRDSPDPTASVELAVVAPAFNHVDAQLIRMRLEQGGFVVYMRDENLPRLHFGWGIAAGGVKIMVRAADAPSAHALLAEPPLAVKLECPSCGSQNVVHDKRLVRGSTIVAGLLLSTPQPQFTHSARCADCGHAWEE